MASDLDRNAIEEVTITLLSGEKLRFVGPTVIGYRTDVRRFVTGFIRKYTTTRRFSRKEGGDKDVDIWEMVLTGPERSSGG